MSGPSDRPAGDRRARWPRVLLPVVILAAIAWWVDPEDVVEALLSLPLSFVVLALFLATADRGLMAGKWWQLLRAAGETIGFSTALRIYYQASASGRVIPVPLGADVLRGYLAAQVGVAEGRAAGSIVVERLMAMLASALPATAGLAYLTLRPPAGVAGVRGWFYGLLALGLVFVLSALTLVLLPPVHRWARTVFEVVGRGRRLPRRSERLLGDTSRSLLQFGARRGPLVGHIGLALGEQLLQYAKFAVLAAGLGLAAFSTSFFAVIAVTLFVRRVGGVVEQWGMGEGSAAVTLALLGVDPDLAVALLVANFTVSTVAVLPGAVLFYKFPLRGRV